MRFVWSVWLLPKYSDKKAFSDYIETFSNLYNSDKFVPHLTLFGRLSISPYPFLPFFEKIKSDAEIVNLKTLNARIGDSYFKKLYLPLSLNKNIFELQRKINNRLKSFREYRFDPHISLAYGNYKVARKDLMLISYKKMISFSSLAVVHTPNKVKNWTVIKKFDFI